METKILLLKFIKYINDNHTDTYGTLQVIINPDEYELEKDYSQTDIGVVNDFLETIK